MIIPFQWIGLFATLSVFAVMFAPALHLAIVMTAVLTVPATVVILDWIFAADFTITPFHIGRQVFFAQMLPMALGASLRAIRPGLAAKLEAPLGRIGNLLLLALAILVLFDMPAIIGATGWTPMFAGIGITVCALAVGAAFAWRRLLDVHARMLNVPAT